ncbi:MAG: hypothetical protein GXO26_05425 [Crenarchaeota archaeon]|nr:hypothetical protein [Thermoproteota archaeon]
MISIIMITILLLREILSIRKINSTNMSIIDKIKDLACGFTRNYIISLFAKDEETI